MEGEKQRPIIKILTKAKLILGIASFLFLTSIGMFFGGWEFLDRWKERSSQQEAQSEMRRNSQQAFFLRQIWKADLDSLVRQSSKDRLFFIQKINTKDSLIILSLSNFGAEMSRQGMVIDKINHKMDIILDKQPKTTKADVVRMFQERDIIENAQARRDSINLVILREIRKRNGLLPYDNIPQPKYGDRAK